MIAAVLYSDVSPRPRSEAVDHVRGLLAHRHDVVDLHPRARCDGKPGESFRLHLLAVADDMIDFRHIGETLRFRLRRAARDDNARVGLVATKATDRLRRLSHRFTRDGAGVDDDRIVEPGVLSMPPHDLGLVRIEPAAERYDFGFRHRAKIALSAKAPL